MLSTATAHSFWRDIAHSHVWREESFGCRLWGFSESGNVATVIQASKVPTYAEATLRPRTCRRLPPKIPATGWRHRVWSSSRINAERCQVRDSYAGADATYVPHGKVLPVAQRLQVVNCEATQRHACAVIVNKMHRKAMPTRSFRSQDAAPQVSLRMMRLAGNVVCFVENGAKAVKLVERWVECRLRCFWRVPNSHQH